MGESWEMRALEWQFGSSSAQCGAYLLGRPTGVVAEFNWVKTVNKSVSLCWIGVRLVASCWFE